MPWRGPLSADDFPKQVVEFPNHDRLANTPLSEQSWSVLTGDPTSHCSTRRGRIGQCDDAMISVLIVEDETIAAEALQERIERVPGFIVAGTVRSGAETLRRLALERISLVLLEICLPDMNGIRVVGAMRAAGYTSDVIVATRERDPRVVQAAVACGIVHYLLKPFTFAALREKLERYRAYHGQLSTAQPFVTQAHIDRILATVRNPGPTDVPKGMSRESLYAVVAIVRGANEGSSLSATEVAAKLGASRVTARKYLEYLVESGLISRRARYGGAHRPEVEYWWCGSQNGNQRMKATGHKPTFSGIVHSSRLTFASSSRRTD
jgi:response regulator of citrate/malate metabolism